MVSSASLVIAIDQGTTSCRALAFNVRGEVVAVAQREFPQYYPQPGWVEHDALEIWQTQRQVLSELTGRLQALGYDRTAIKSVGITNQRETSLIWNKRDGKPIAKAIVWQDRRTSDYCRKLAPAYQAMVKARTGLSLDPYFSATKLRWLLTEVNGAAEAMSKGELAFGTMDSWLVWQLSHGQAHVTDYSNASRTMLLNIHSLAWDDELLALFDIPESILPRLVDSSGFIGECAGGIDELNWLKGVPIGGIVGDQQGASFGQACYKPGTIKNTYGTGCFLLCQTGARAIDSSAGLLTTLAWKYGDMPAQYALEGSVFAGGATIQWLRDGLGIIQKASDSESLAQSVKDNGGVTLVPAFAGLGAPYWQPEARGLICGLTRGTQKGHLARAALESIAHQVTDLVESLRAEVTGGVSEMRVDGGASTNDFLMQLQADLADIVLLRPKVTETTAFGAAALAGLASGVWHENTLQQIWQLDRRFEPKMTTSGRQTARLQWQEAIARTCLNLTATA